MKSDCLDIAVRAAREAGEALMRYYAKTVEVKLKGDGYDAANIVTVADLESEKIIVDVLKNTFPDHGIFSEEAGGLGADSDFVWYIDPLDGTSNFTRHIPLFGISIGLVHLGEPVLGVLYFPAINLLVQAEKGKGCFANDVPVAVSKRSIKESLYYSGGKYRGEQQLEMSIAQTVGMVKIIDASSFEFAQIAMGDAEIYYLNNVPHDVVAGICIVQEAGGTVTDGDGNPWRLDSRMILATNGAVHREVLVCL